MAADTTEEETTMAGGVTVVTHVITTSQTPPETKELPRRGMVALGTVQIIIGLMDLLFGVVMVLHVDSMAVVFGVFVWGALIFITAGSVTVTAGKSMTRCLMDTAVGFNALAGAASAGASIIYLLDAFGLSNMIDYYLNPHGSFLYNHSTMDPFMIRSRGVSIVLGCFSIVELCVSLYLTVLGCSHRQATDQPPTIEIDQSNEAAAETVLPAYEAPPIAPPPSDNNYEMVKSQEYNTTII